jgi:ferredoxin
MAVACDTFSNCHIAQADGKPGIVKRGFMANYSERQKENVAGAFYVDVTCIDCDVCRDIAPENFTRQEDAGYSYVWQQPSSDQEMSLCREAMEACPVEAIGDDGQ